MITCEIKKILNTEKTSAMSTSVLTMMVSKNSTKDSIQKQFMSIFPNSKISKIRTLNEKSHERTFRGRKGVVPGYKKAYITLSSGPVDVNDLKLD